MLTPEELKARRQAATREAKNSIPVFGIIVGVIVFGGMFFFLFQRYQALQSGPGPVLLRYIAALKAGDWTTAKSLATANSVSQLDAFAKLFKLQENAQKMDGFKKLDYSVDKVDIQNNVATVTLRKSKSESAARLEDCVFVLVAAGDTWKVDEPLSLQRQSGRGGRFPD